MSETTLDQIRHWRDRAVQGVVTPLTTVQIIRLCDAAERAETLEAEVAKWNKCDSLVCPYEQRRALQQLPTPGKNTDSEAPAPWRWTGAVRSDAGTSGTFRMGKRGPKVGATYRPTLDKAKLREGLRAYVAKHIDRMTRAQVVNACGIGHLFTRDKGGKFTRIENEAEVERLMTQGTEGTDYWIFTKDPSVQAYQALIDQTIDKAPQHVAVTGSEGGPIELVARLQIARRAHTREG